MQTAQFRQSKIPYLLVFPQLFICCVFFFWPSVLAFFKSFTAEDPFMGTSIFVGLDNFKMLFNNSDYLKTFGYTLFYSAIVSLSALFIALVLASCVHSMVNQHAKKTYRTLIIWVYAVAPAAAGFAGASLFNQHFGPVTLMLKNMGIDFNIAQNADDVSIVIILMSIWKQISVNFIFLLAALQHIPQSVQEASRLDCRSPIKRFWTMTFPLIAPTNFFLLIINIIYAFFETFATIDMLTNRGLPGGKTLVYLSYLDYRGQDYGGSAAQSIILMALVLLLTFVQFRYIEKRVHYT